MRIKLTVLLVGLAIVGTACVSVASETDVTSEAASASEAGDSAQTRSAPAKSAGGMASAEDLRTAFIDAMSSGDLGQGEALLVDAQPSSDVMETIAAMMQDGVVLSAGDDDCGQSEGCLVFTDWSMAFTLRMEATSSEWTIVGIGLDSTD